MESLQLNRSEIVKGEEEDSFNQGNNLGSKPRGLINKENPNILEFSGPAE